MQHQDSSNVADHASKSMRPQQVCLAAQQQQQQQQASNGCIQMAHELWQTASPQRVTESIVGQRSASSKHGTSSHGHAPVSHLASHHQPEAKSQQHASVAAAADSPDVQPLMAESEGHSSQHSPSHAASHSTLSNGLRLSPQTLSAEHDAQEPSVPNAGRAQSGVTADPGSEQYHLARLWSNAASALEAACASPFCTSLLDLDHPADDPSQAGVDELLYNPEDLVAELHTSSSLRAHQGLSSGHATGDDAGGSKDRQGEGDSPGDAANHAGYGDAAPARSSSEDMQGSSVSGSGSGTDSGSEEAESSDNMDFAMRYCLNCTAASSGTMCLDCGHFPQKDAQLMSGTLSTPHGCMVGLPGATSTASRPTASAQTVLVYDERMERHVEGRHQPHPERPDRIRAVMARLLASGLASQCVRLPCEEASPELLHSIHRPEFVSAVDAMSARLVPPRDHLHAVMQAYEEPANTHAYFTPDTYVNRYSSGCARLAAGGCAAVAAAVARGEAANGAAIVRPPGHHAESGTAMGFCFFNNAGIAAKAAQAAGASRILILDWDVHHGNGTQHIFSDDPSVLFMSLHRHDGGHFYPGTGDANEVGYGPGTGYTVNVAWPRAGMTDGDYLAAFMHIVLPIAYEYRPSLIIVSAGYDAALGDPIGGCRLTAEGYAHMTALLGAVAPLAVLLEGGYNLGATAAGTEATLRVLLGQQPPPLPHAPVPSAAALSAMQATIQCQAPFWQCMQALLPPLVTTVPPSPFRACPPTPQSITAGRLEADGPSSRISGPPLDPLDHEPLTSRGSGILLRTPSATLRDHGESQGDVSVHGPSFHGSSPAHGSRGNGGPTATRGMHGGLPGRARTGELTMLDSLAEEDDEMSSGDEAQSSAQGSDVHATASSPGPPPRAQPSSPENDPTGNQTPQHVPSYLPPSSGRRRSVCPAETTQVLHHYEGGVRVQEVLDISSREDLEHPDQLLRDALLPSAVQDDTHASPDFNAPVPMSGPGIGDAAHDSHPAGGSRHAPSALQSPPAQLQQAAAARLPFSHDKQAVAGGYRGRLQGEEGYGLAHKLGHRTLGKHSREGSDHDTSDNGCSPSKEMHK